MKTLRKVAIWKPYCSVLALLLTAGAGRADVILDWNAIMQATVSAQPPFPQARFAAITQLAVFEAVNAITHDYRPYLGTISAPSGASTEAAAVAAAHTVLKNYFPGSAMSLDLSRASSLVQIADSPDKTAGILVGEAAAAAMIAARASDGSAPAAFSLPSSSDPGVWQVTPSCSPAGGAFFHWRNVKPFGILSASQFRLDPPTALTRNQYSRSYNEVKEVGGINSTERPKDRADVAQFYAAVSPVGVFNRLQESSAPHRRCHSRRTHVRSRSSIWPSATAPSRLSIRSMFTTFGGPKLQSGLAQSTVITRRIPMGRSRRS